MLKRLALYLIICLPLQYLAAQEANTTDTGTVQLKSPEKYIDAVGDKAKSIEEKLNKKSEKALAQLKKQEGKIIKKLERIDSTAAKQLKENAMARYKELEEKLKNPGKLQQYIPYLDSLGTSLNFLTENSQLLKNTKEVQDKLKDAITKVDALKAQLQKAENLKQFLKERKEFLKQQVEKFGFRHGGQVVKQLKQLNKQVYYYSQQIAEYKAILKDPKKIEKKALELLAKTKVFQEFMRKNSMLATLFPMPGGNGFAGTSTQGTGFAGLQTRVLLTSFIDNLPGGGPGVQGFSQTLQRNIQSVQGITDQFKNKLKGMVDDNGMEMPDFKVNNQKVKSFKQRLEIGTNFQSQKANSFFPTTTDLGLSVGYKLNDKSIVGLGTSFKVGWGSGIEHIKVSGQGLSLRSFLDIKLKKGFYASGGFEYNCQEAFSEMRQLYKTTAWKQSGLLGITKIVSLKSKLLKQTKVQILYDFLYRKQLPVTQPLKFRIGYSF
jgi:hypothetical protein